jgi:Bacterial mobilisation protein (MobC).
MEKNSKCGRHSKELHKKRRYQINVKLMTDEFYELNAKAINAAIPRNDYVRNCIKQSIIIQRLTPPINELVRKLTGMANNLNQIAKRANQAGYDSIRDEYLYLAEQIDELLNYIRHDCENSNRKQL